MSMNPEQKQKQRVESGPIHRSEEQQDLVQEREAHLEGQEAAQQEQQLAQDVQALRMEDVEVIDGPLLHAEPTFARKEASIYRQRDAGQIERSRKKAGRKEAAADQAQSDQAAQRKLSSRQIQLQMQRDNPDAILEQTLITEELLLSENNLEERVDVTGHLRRKNAEKYADSKSVGIFMRRAAQKDVENLVNNLRKDIILEGEFIIPEEVVLYTDAFYFSNLYCESVLRQKTMALRAMEADGRSTPQDIEALSEQKKKVEMTALLLKSMGSNFCIPGIQLARQIRACQLARRQILDEGTTPYHMLMVHILDQQIAAKQEEYRQQVHKMNTLSNTINTPKGTAQMDLIRRLADLKRQVKRDNITEEEQEELKDQAYHLIDTFDYAGSE